MPIEEFGKALIRGMGWKEGEAIGNTNKGFVCCLLHHQLSLW